MKYVVYLTEYRGTLMPRFYIGSTDTEKIAKGYLGSPISKKWKKIFFNEVKQHRELFSIKILSYHATRKLALEAELAEQLLRNVIQDDNYINRSLAKVNGFFGATGSRGPMAEETRQKIASYVWINDGTFDKRISKYELQQYISNGWVRGRKPMEKSQREKLRGKHSEERKSKLRKPKSAEHIQKSATAHKKPIVFLGVHYPSQKDATLATGKTRPYIMRRIKSPQFLDCYMVINDPRVG